MPEIVISEAITGPPVEALKERHAVLADADLWRQPERLFAAVESAKALVVRNQTQVTAELLARAPQLQIVARAGVGLDNIDVEAASRQGIVVTYAPRENSVSVAELAMGLLLALARKIPAADRDTRAGGWHRREFTGSELAGKTLGIIGLGRIGRLVAQRARAFEMQVVAHDALVDPASPELAALGVRLVGLDDLLAVSDAISCHVPLTRETRGMFNDALFARAKPGALFINTARGEVVDEAALLRALEGGRLGGAALDVRASEPPASGPLAALDNVILLPHVGAFTHEAQARVVAAICRDVAAVLSGDEAAGAVNFARPKTAGHAAEPT